MAKNLQLTPVIVRASFPKPPSDATKLLEWSRDTYRELENFRQLLDKLFRNSTMGGSDGGDGGEDTDPGVPPFAINADTVDGYHAVDLLRYARSLSFKHFDNENSGYVFRGRPNGSLCRIFIDDSDLSLPLICVEEIAGAVPGDVAFATSAIGPVLIGRYNSGVFRFVVSDAEAGAPMIGIEKLSSVSSVNDYDELFYKGYGWINRGRTNKLWWLWFVDDTNPEGVIAFEKVSINS